MSNLIQILTTRLKKKNQANLIFTNFVKILISNPYTKKSYLRIFIIFKLLGIIKLTWNLVFKMSTFLLGNNFS